MPVRVLNPTALCRPDRASPLLARFGDEWRTKHANAPRRTERPRGARLPWWPDGAPCKTSSDQEICSFACVATGLCGVLMAHRRVCTETHGSCPAHDA